MSKLYTNVVSQEIIRKPFVLLAVSRSQHTEARGNQSTSKKAHMPRITEKGLGEISMSDLRSVLKECVDCTHALTTTKLIQGLR